MKRDLWMELARRARTQGEPDSAPPFAFEREVLLAVKRKPFPAEQNEWGPLLRPALALAFAVMLLCLLLQFRVSPEAPELDPLAQTDAILQTALYNNE